MTKTEFLNEHQDVINFLRGKVVGHLKDARMWSAFGMLWQAAIQQEWWSDFISDSMFELSSISPLLVKQRVSDFMMYIVHPQLFAQRLFEYLTKGVSNIVAISKEVKNSGN